MTAPTDRMNDLFDQGRPRRQASADGTRVIAIRGAREHNLKNIDLEIPRDQLVVFTGLSGSGKSSLAFDTIYAEGQRRYVESLSAYARQFLEMMQKPDVDQIDGLSPATTCGCFGRAWACPIRPPPACRSKARPYRRWSTG
jgi:excinuclease ABC subunit A